jgi:hypothetical protein
LVYDRDDINEPPLKEIVGWVELAGGMDYESQHHAIVNALIDFNVVSLTADYTGVGRAVVDRLQYAIGDVVAINPYTFSKQSKSDMWYNLREHIDTRRLVIPANSQARATTEFQHFQEQLLNCQKWFDGAYLCAEKSDGHLDDYCDSLALMLLADNFEVEQEIEMEDFNPFFTQANELNNNFRKYRH